MGALSRKKTLRANKIGLRMARAKQVQEAEGGEVMERANGEMGEEREDRSQAKKRRALGKKRLAELGRLCQEKGCKTEDGLLALWREGGLPITTKH